MNELSELSELTSGPSPEDTGSEPTEPLRGEGDEEFVDSVEAAATSASRPYRHSEVQGLLLPSQAQALAGAWTQGPRQAR
eukprot:s1658_g1.t1